ncbi:hypothetical protein K488DRAFT_88230 [Vararia minispora EC-137]|uniref:Uncharacterized protein n=1 Tax=Vararia minispora EC-137 TaxID=1314806 RepID=A0ACB8QDZ5_9AGAM|nr:hypothetical protein K488DRAFT_88230 [Vararia minispora EC-137]
MLLAPFIALSLAITPTVSAAPRTLPHSIAGREAPAVGRDGNIQIDAVDHLPADAVNKLLTRMTTLYAASSSIAKRDAANITENMLATILLDGLVAAAGTNIFHPEAGPASLRAVRPPAQAS